MDTDQAHSVSIQVAAQEAAATDIPVLTRMDKHVFKAAKEGKIDDLRSHDNLNQILTATSNTVLHVYIAYASTPKRFKPKDEALIFVNSILEICPTLLWQQNKSGETALHLAARHGHADIVQSLIETAKDRRREDLEQGGAAVASSLSSEEEAAWKIFIRTLSKEKDTALHEAVRFNHLRVAEILTREDPDFSYPPNVAGETPLYLAAERRYGPLFDTIIDTCKKPTYEGPIGRTALHAAVIYGDKEMTTKLLNKAKHLAIEKDEEGWTPLHHAAFYGHVSIVESLLEANECSAYMGDKADEKTALHIAASGGRVNVMEKLIAYCPDCCEAVDKRRRNALHYAFENHKFLIKEFVVKDAWLSNILLNGKDVDGNTPLHLLDTIVCGTPFFGDPRVDKMAFNKENKTALDLSIANDIDSIYKIFLEIALKWFGAVSGYRIRSKSDQHSQKIKDKKGGKDTGTDKDIRESHLIVATLVATVTFAAGVTMPGGYYQASDQENGMSKRQTPGYAVLTNITAFQFFCVFDMLALCLSTFSVLVHLYILTIPEGQKRSKRFWRLIIYITMLSVVAMMVAFTLGTFAVLGNSPALAISCFITVIYAFVLVTYVTMFDLVVATIMRLTRLSPALAFSCFLKLRG